jgi:hypothetical protein
MEWSCPECAFTGMSKERLIFHRRTHKTSKQQGQDDDDDEDLAPILTANLPLPPIPQLDFDDDNEGQRHDLVEPVDLDPPIIHKNLPINLNPSAWGLEKVNKQIRNREIETIFKFFLSITEISECTKKSKKEERAKTSSTKLYLYFM